jgi:hypothetical protein
MTQAINHDDQLLDVARAGRYAMKKAAFELPRPLPRDARGKYMPIVVMTDYGRRTSPRFAVELVELDGGWSSAEFLGDRHHEALAAIDRLKAERTIGDVVFEKGIAE